MTEFPDYVIVMTANGMHFCGRVNEPHGVNFGRVELTDTMMLNFGSKGELGLGPYMLGATRLTVYPVLIVKLPDLPENMRKGIVSAFVKSRSGLHLT